MMSSCWALMSKTVSAESYCETAHLSIAESTLFHFPTSVSDSFHSIVSCRVKSGVFLILERVGAWSKSFQIHHAQRQPEFMSSLLPYVNR